MNAKLLIAFLVLIPFLAKAQKKEKIELLQARSLQFDKRIGRNAQRLIGDVIFRHEGAKMYCDSAYLYQDSNSLDAFGSVKVEQGDTLNMFSDRLFYDGNTRLVKVRDNVTLRDSEMTLTTNTLDYDRNTGQAVFYDSGRIISRENNNELIACEGIYDSGSEIFFFRDSVFLENPKYRVETDTLHYANRTEIAYFFGPTFIYSENNTIYCENGWYDTRNDVAEFSRNAYIDNGEQMLRGDSIDYCRESGLGRAYGNVSVIDTSDSYLIRGEYGEYNEVKGRNFVTGRAEMLQYDELDTLFLHGDTLMALEDSSRGDLIFAYPSVKFFRADLQGAADSLVYAKNDSLIRMYTRPVLWSEELQITGDTILIRTYGSVVEKMYVFDHAFMVNRVDSSKYNQIKGKRLTGFFHENDLRRILVKGNGQSLYYAAEEEEADTAVAKEPEYIGVNRAICSNIEIFMKERKVDRILFLTKPEGSFYPLEQFSSDLAYFDGFNWDEARRPKSREDIFLTEPSLKE
jgi:lipopolysaccharide export system protein LptA